MDGTRSGTKVAKCLNRAAIRLRLWPTICLWRGMVSTIDFCDTQTLSNPLPPAPRRRIFDGKNSHNFADSQR
jgi:hypothetical protein